MSNGQGGQIESPKKAMERAERNIGPGEADRLAYERSPERSDDILHAENKSTLEALQESYAEPPTDNGVHTHQPVVSKDEVVIEVEKILEDGIGPYYASLPEDAKLLFKKKGEEVANEISEMVRTFRVRFKRLISLISSWLQTIPGVNRYFLEQEAKIKADRIVELIEARKQDRV